MLATRSDQNLIALNLKAAAGGEVEAGALHREWWRLEPSAKRSTGEVAGIGIEDFGVLIDQVHAQNFGVNYDPSNTFLAGEDPLELLERVKHRVVTMHASDRYLAEGTIEDLRKEEDSVGYASRLRHGEIGQGMNDYDAIFSALAGVGFDGWISIEDGVDGIDQLHRSAQFLRKKMAQYWPG